MQSEEITHNLKDVNQWMRIVYMVLFAVLFNVSTFILWLVATIQALFALITGRPNSNIRELAAGVSHYIHDIARFLSYSTEDKPFPFQPWPDVELEDLPEPTSSYTPAQAQESPVENNDTQEPESEAPESEAQLSEDASSEEPETETDAPNKT